ncbi:MAG: DUF3617 family protein [Deltaproteobacteria bacterium]|nr:DUF3617 family protein [Deltaproteobacteria bacterium]MBW2219721.1 DUF3617 family protein [Deltaproteobacteria bacterium]
MVKKLLFVSVFILAAASIAFAGPNIKEGKWEMTTKMEMAGMPMEMPAVTHTQCLTKKDLVPQNAPDDQKCEPVKTKINGNTVTWTINCNSEGGPAKGSGKITYSGDSFKGTVKMKQGGMDMTSHITGKYIGKCE